MNIWNAKNFVKNLYKRIKRKELKVHQFQIDALIGAQIINPNSRYVKKIEELL